MIDESRAASDRGVDIDFSEPLTGAESLRRFWGKRCRDMCRWLAANVSSNVI